MKSERLTYRLPCPSDGEILRGYMDEHHAAGEPSVTASMGFSGMAFADWIQSILHKAEQGDGDWGRSLLLLAFCGGTLVGLLSVRYDLSPQFRESVGDIGYGVRPSERRKGYATEMLRHGLDLCRDHGMKNAILGCYRDNAASERTILKCGGRLILEGEFYQKGRISRYYKMDL